MVKAPEKFLDEYLGHEKGSADKADTKLSRAKMSRLPEEELTRLKQNLQTIWGIYQTPEIKEILSRKRKISFLALESVNVNMTISYVDSGIAAEYEIDRGSKKDLAGARLYQQAEMSLNRYITHEKGIENLLKTTNPALQVLIDNFIQKELLEEEVWYAIAKGELVRLSTVSYFV
ncbi:MAG: hypothetical protein E3K32_06570 [wastewater metagenome]|nr:hypothetical protein [Candidatus Loosdrechtia aerotolerans]